MTMHMRSHYHELPPPLALADRLVCLWSQSIDEHSGVYHHPVLPDGCVDIVWIGDAAPVVAGPSTQRFVARLPAGTRIIGVRLRPGWAYSSLGVSADALLNQHVPLAEIWDGSAAPLIEPVLSHAAASARLTEAISALTARFASAPLATPNILHSIAWLRCHPASRVRDLAGTIGVSDRQLQRDFCTAVGYGPKTFQRILRFQCLLALSSRIASGRENLAGLAYNAGYADQAHMCREVRALAGETPCKLLGKMGSTLVMSDLFNTSAGLVG